MPKLVKLTYFKVTLIYQRVFIAYLDLFTQGEACTSCSSSGTGIGDGIAVPGPKGEKGDSGPPGSGKPGKNVREF